MRRGSQPKRSQTTLLQSYFAAHQKKQYRLLAAKDPEHHYRDLLQCCAWRKMLSQRVKQRVRKEPEEVAL